MSLSKKSFSLFKRDAFLFFANTLTSVIIARKLGPETTGVWIVLSLIPIYAESFGRFKFDIAAVYFLGKGLYTEKDVERTLNSVAIIVSLIICVPTIVFSKQICTYLFNGSMSNLFYLRLVILQIPFSFLYMNYSYILIYRENIKVYNLMTVIKALVGSFGALILILFFDLGISAVVITSVVSVLLGLLYGYLKSSFKSNIKYDFLNLQMVRDFSGYAFRLYLSGIIGNLNAYVMRSLLTKVLVISKLTFFSIAQDRATFLNKIPEATNMLLFSRISKADSDIERNELASKGLRLVFLLTLVAGILAILCIKPLVWILYGNDYLPMVTPFMCFIPGVIASGCISVLVQYFNGINKPNAQILIFSMILFLQVFLVFIFWSKLTIVFASICFSISMILVFLFSILLFLNYSKLPITSIYIKKNDFKYLYNFLNDWAFSKLPKSGN
jgi:O-antigen/teichoic acid export membrane protein